MPKKKVSSKQTRQTRPIKVVSKRSAANKRYQKVLKSLKVKHGIDHKTAQATYRRITEHLGKTGVSTRDIKSHPRITSKSVRIGITDVKRQAKEKRQIESAKISATSVINQAIKELSENAPAIRHSIIDSHMEHSLDGDLLVKITVKGKDYTRVITGNIVNRKGSQILKWKWTSKHHGRRHKR